MGGFDATPFRERRTAAGQLGERRKLGARHLVAQSVLASRPAPLARTGTFKKEKAKKQKSKRSKKSKKKKEIKRKMEISSGRPAGSTTSTYRHRRAAAAEAGSAASTGCKEAIGERDR